MIIPDAPDGEPTSDPVALQSDNFEMSATLRHQRRLR